MLRRVGFHPKVRVHTIIPYELLSRRHQVLSSEYNFRKQTPWSFPSGKQSTTVAISATSRRSHIIERTITSALSFSKQLVLKPMSSLKQCLKYHFSSVPTSFYPCSKELRLCPANKYSHVFLNLIALLIYFFLHAQTIYIFAHTLSSCPNVFSTLHSSYQLESLRLHQPFLPSYLFCSQSRATTQKHSVCRGLK